jgi:hypothetical protein
MSNVTKRSGAPKHRRAWAAKIVEVEIEHDGRAVKVPFEVQAGGHVYYRRGPRGGPLRRVREPAIINAVHAELRRRTESA